MTYVHKTIIALTAILGASASFAANGDQLKLQDGTCFEVVEEVVDETIDETTDELLDPALLEEEVVEYTIPLELNEAFCLGGDTDGLVQAQIQNRIRIADDTGTGDMTRDRNEGGRN